MARQPSTPVHAPMRRLVWPRLDPGACVPRSAGSLVGKLHGNVRRIGATLCRYSTGGRSLRSLGSVRGRIPVPRSGRGGPWPEELEGWPVKVPAAEP